MAFQLNDLLSRRAADAYELCARHLNEDDVRLLQSMGIDRTYVRGEAAYLYDADGHRYLDYFSGFGVFAIGRNHPVVIGALREALDAQLPSLVQMDAPLLAGLLAESLTARSPHTEKVFFCNSGTEAVEAAMKFARATGRTRIVYGRRGFHGLTLGSLSLMGNSEFRQGYEPLVPDCDEIPLGDAKALEAALGAGNVAALVIEPIQGTGVYEYAKGYWQTAQRLCRQHGTLLIADEVQTGLGRTGRFFAFEHYDLEPDVVLLSKALSGGLVPIGAVLCRRAIFEKVFAPAAVAVGRHGSTFSKNVLAMVAGLATLSVIDDAQLVQRAADLGARLRARLQSLCERMTVLRAVRGRGLMLGLEFDSAVSRAPGRVIAMKLLREHRILTQPGGTDWNSIKILPPMITTESDLDWFCDSLTSVLSAL